MKDLRGVFFQGMVISSTYILENRDDNGDKTCLANQEYAINHACISEGYATDP